MEIDPLCAASQPGEELVGDGAGSLGYLLHREPGAQKGGLVPRADLRDAGDIGQGLVHTDAPNNGSCKFSDSHIRSPVG